MKQLMVGTAGHVDHGKTSLIKSITGFDTDYLPEEKKRGMTIEPGFTHFSPDKDILISFIDVPGHEKFLKNMLGGISGIDFCLLIIAATEGIMPQTIEHFNILKFLDIKNGAIILTKVDLVDDEIISLVLEDVKSLVKGSFLEKSTVIKFSAVTEQGKQYINDLLKNNSLEKKVIVENVFLPVDRIFSKQGFGTVIAGNLISGSIKENDLLELMPSKKIIRIRNIQSHGKIFKEINSGVRVALSSSDIKIDEFKKGDILVTPDSYQITETIDVKITIADNLEKEVKSNDRIRFYYYNSEVIGRISFPGKKNLGSGETDYARIKLEKPMIIKHDSRFIIRNYSPMYLLGGGIVLNPYISTKKVNIDKRRSILKLYENKNYLEILKLYINEDNGLFKIDDLEILIPPEENKLIEQIKKEGLICQLNNTFFISNNKFKQYKNDLLIYLKDFQEKSNSKIGVTKQELQNDLKLDLIIIEKILQECLAQQLINTYQNLYFIGNNRKIFNTLQQEKLFNSILELLKNNNFLSLKDLIEKLKIDEVKLSELLKIMVYENKIIDLQGNIFIEKDNWDLIVQNIKQYIAKEKMVTPTQLKDFLHTSRKYLIPLLEKLDQLKVTRRQDNYRTLY